MERIEYQRMAELEGRLWWYRALHAAMVERLRRLALPAGARVLDAGCGTGGLLKSLRARLPDFVLAGLERDAEAASTARDKSSAPVVVGDVGAMPFASGRFDAIVCTDVLYHRNVDEDAAVREAIRCLRPGGSLLLTLPAHEWLRSSHDDHVHGARRYTADRVRRLIAAAGFRVRSVGYANSLLYPLMVVHRLTTGRRREASDVRAIHPWLDAALYSVTRAERRLEAARVRFPTGGTVWAWAVKP